MADREDTHQPHSHEGHGCSLSGEERQRLSQEIEERLHANGMRVTQALRDLIAVLLDQHRPFTLQQLQQVPSLADRDPATIYRLVMKLRDLGVLRHFPIGASGNYFQLDTPDHHHDYLVCIECGTLTDVPFPCAVQQLETQLAEQLKWKKLSHSLVFQGVCPDCSS